MSFAGKIENICRRHFFHANKKRMGEYYVSKNEKIQTGIKQGRMY